MFQIASIHEMVGNNKQALKWFQILLAKVNGDPNILERVGSLFKRVSKKNKLSKQLKNFRRKMKIKPYITLVNPTDFCRLI